MKDERESFYLVWNPQGREPQQQHPSLERAEREAERLARLHRGQRFIVLRSVSECVVDDVRRIRHVESDELPF